MPTASADCFPPDASCKVEGDEGGKTDSHHSSFSNRTGLPQAGKQ
jgi:hypothetical protein